MFGLIILGNVLEGEFINVIGIFMSQHNKTHTFSGPTKC